VLIPLTINLGGFPGLCRINLICNLPVSHRATLQDLDCREFIAHSVAVIHHTIAFRVTGPDISASKVDHVPVWSIGEVLISLSFFAVFMASIPSTK